MKTELEMRMDLEKQLAKSVDEAQDIIGCMGESVKGRLDEKLTVSGVERLMREFAGSDDNASVDAYYQLLALKSELSKQWKLKRQIAACRRACA